MSSAISLNRDAGIGVLFSRQAHVRAIKLQGHIITRPFWTPGRFPCPQHYYTFASRRIRIPFAFSGSDQFQIGSISIGYPFHIPIRDCQTVSTQKPGQPNPVLRQTSACKLFAGLGSLKFRHANARHLWAYIGAETRCYSRGGDPRPGWRGHTKGVERGRFEG
jgi:hypothetical protein